MICLTLKLSRSFLSTVYNVKNFFNFFIEKVLLRKRGSGRLNEERKEGFVTVLAKVIKKDPTMSIRKHANELKVYEKTEDRN